MRLKLFSLLLFMYSINVGIILTIIPLFSEILGADRITVGLIVSIYAAGLIVGAPFWGKMSLMS